MEKPPRGSLDGLLVLDLTGHLSGPYAAMMLADHGADVLKIEQPGTGDSARGMPPFVNGESAPFMIWNRNKRSVALDFKQPADKAALLELVDRADILIENYRPGVMDRLGIGWDVLHARNPRLIYGAISGFGQTGPYASRGGFDLITQGMSGLMSTNGPEDGPPHRLPIAISDVTAGMFLAFGLLAAVEARHRTGEGQIVETSLLEAQPRWPSMKRRIISPPAPARHGLASSTAAARRIGFLQRRTATSRSGRLNRNSSSASAG